MPCCPALRQGLVHDTWILRRGMNPIHATTPKLSVADCCETTQAAEDFPTLQSGPASVFVCKVETMFYCCPPRWLAPCPDWPVRVTLGLRSFEMHSHIASLWSCSSSSLDCQWWIRRLLIPRCRLYISQRPETADRGHCIWSW